MNQPTGPEKLPPIVQRMAQQFAPVWEAYNQLGEAVSQAGPLDPKQQRLVKLALAVGAQLQGAVHSHTRRGLRAGWSPEQLRHVALLAITTLGWPSAMTALSWIEEELEKQGVGSSEQPSSQ